MKTKSRSGIKNSFKRLMKIMRKMLKKVKVLMNNYPRNNKQKTVVRRLNNPKMKANQNNQQIFKQEKSKTDMEYGIRTKSEFKDLSTTCYH